MKNYFTFENFENLQAGDCFKFETVLDDLTPSLFYSVYSKDSNTTKICTKYGKLNKIELSNNCNKKILVYPERKRK